MNADSREQRNDFPLEWVKQQLRALSAVEPPKGLRARLLDTIPGRTACEAAPWQPWRWLGATGWAGLAAAVIVLGSVVWLRTTAPSGRPLADANSGSGVVLAADYNSVRPADINTLDSNGL